MYCLVLALSVLFMAQGVTSHVTAIGGAGVVIRSSSRHCEWRGGVCADSCLTKQRRIGFCSDVGGICCR
uniref:Beta-defensin 103-like n=1 Tax=Callorhinchus milii TaxID=7868 RepID=A0A4W3HHB6_CALMI|eukprot:gi/632975994/ref/XP_007904543.1/ PREDICTED: beta-defensin 103-like [Callorhinchus milii]